MKWIVTGGCGFVGSNLVNYLVKQGDTVVAADNLSRFGAAENLKWLDNELGDNFEFIHLDTRAGYQVEQLVKRSKPDAIAHLAGQVAMTTSIANPRLDFETNSFGTFNVLEAVRLCSPDTVVLYSSSNKVYGDLGHIRTQEVDTRYILPDYPDGLDEKTPLSAHSPYGCSKLSADQYAQDYYRMYGVRTVVFRHSSMYGGHQYATFDQGWVGWFCQKAVETRKDQAMRFTINGNGKQVRDLLYADDLTKLYRRAVEVIEKTAGNAYNIGGGMANSLSLLELFDYLEKKLIVKLNFSKLDWRAGDQKVFIADNTKISDHTGWEPKVSKSSGIDQMLEWTESIINS